MKKIAKFFTMKRVIILMSLGLLYSAAFVFATVYADRSFISRGEPSDRSLVTSAPEKAEETDILPSVDYYETAAVTTAPTAASEPVSESFPSPEQLVDKELAGRAVMKLAAGSQVPDIGEITVTEAETSAATEKKTEKTAAATTSEEKKTEATAKKTEPVTEKSKTPETTTTSEEVEEADDDIVEEFDDDSEEYDVVDDVVDADELPYGDELSEEDLQQILDRIGVSSIEELLATAEKSSPAAQNNQPTSGGYIPSSTSYKNEIVSIYDTVKGRVRTENAYDLVCEIVNYEVGDSFEPEAIKAQAVAAYTYIKYYEQKGEYAELGTRADPSDKVKKAVDAVDGLALYYDGKYIMTPFSASQGGYSASSKNVWGGDLPYLQSVRNDFDSLDTKYYGQVTTYTAEELRQKIESKTDIKLSDNYSEWIRVLSINDGIYAGQLSIDGHTEAYISGKTRTITGHIFRTYVLNIKSTAFTVSYSNGVFTFTTYGYGHGVGLSQIGANLYAKNGYTFDQILTHYFTGVTIK